VVKELLALIARELAGEGFVNVLIAYCDFIHNLLDCCDV
jgi:hypothetical protein